MIEDILRNILAEELQKFKDEVIGELNKLRPDESTMDKYGETLTVDEAAKLLKVSKYTLYELARNPRFPCKRIGSRIIIPTRKFFQWVNETGSV